MPRYFFDLECGKHGLDKVGVDLVGPDAARHEAAPVVGEMLQNDPSEFWKHSLCTVTVSNQDKLVLFKLFVDAIEGPGFARPPGKRV
jgi:hypothetical protein